jgi:hypothetical protein
MKTSYDQISNEVGYVGYQPYLPMEEMDQLFSNLSLNPTVTDFKWALSLYRFMPEVETEEQLKIIHKLQLGLSISKKKLFPEIEKPAVLETAAKLFMSILPF